MGNHHHPVMLGNIHAIKDAMETDRMNSMFAKDENYLNKKISVNQTATNFNLKKWNSVPS